MIGIVLSGGQSSRMGQDKGLMKVHEKVWARMASEKLSAQSIPTFISINELQLQEYLKYFDRNELLVDCADLKTQGPLTGVLSAHLLHPDQDVMVLACDMLNMRCAVLEKLKQEFQIHRPEAIGFKGMNIEPLCAIYSAYGLGKIKTQYKDNQLRTHSMMSILEILRTHYLPVSEEWQQSFKNFNRIDDLD